MKRNTLRTALLGALAWAIFSISAHSQPFNAVQNRTNSPAYVPGEILIKFKDGATDAQLQDAVGIAGVSSIVRHIHTPAMKDRGDREITHVRTARSTDDAIKALKNHPAIDYAQPNWIYQHQTINDPYYNNGSLWGIYGLNTVPSCEFGSGAAAAWNAVSGTKTVYIGIIDEGIQYNHPDLIAHIWVNQNEIAGNRKDDDSNGYIDDIYGWNAINNNGSIYSSAYDDHGTHVAGTIGASANSTGVIGVAGGENMKFISGKFLGPNGGTTTDAIEAIDYMIALKTHNGLNIVALNNSWGGGGFDQMLLDAIVRAAKANMLFVVAAGNGDTSGVAINTDVNPSYPAFYDTTASAGYNSVISVTAIDKTGGLPGWANYGATSVDLGAPGVDILSTLNNSTYGYASGTSMATPHVTGAIALYALQNPGATPDDIRTALLNATTATPSLTGKTVTGGRLDIVNLLFPPSEVPAAPSGLTASQVAGDTKVLLNWTDNSANETSFKIGRSDGINSTTITVAADLKTYTDTGLTPNATYSYSIAASNGKGESNWIPAPNPVTISGIAYATVARKADDTVTKGSWVGTYGNQSYDMISSKKAATGVALASSGLINIWAASTTDVRGLQTPDKTSRTARCYYSIPAYGLTSFDLDVNLADNATHKVSLYCVDWDTVKRNQMIQVVDCNYNTVIDERTITGFNGGMYLVWEVKGHVLFRIVNNSTSSGNAVVSGIFIDDPNYVTPTLPAAPGNLIAAPGSSAGKINLAWTDRSSNENGFVIQRSTKSSSGFTTIITLGAGATSYGDSGLKSGILYYYRVYAFNTAGSSGYISASAKAK